MRKPIDPTTHVALDYGLAALLFYGPGMLRLGLRARLVSYLFATLTAGVTVLTRSRITPLTAITPKEHGRIEKPTLPMMLALPWLTGAMRRPSAAAFFIGVFGMALTSYLFTDFDADEDAALARPAVTKGVLRRADGVLSPR